MRANDANRVRHPIWEMLARPGEVSRARRGSPQGGFGDPVVGEGGAVGGRGRTSRSAHPTATCVWMAEAFHSFQLARYSNSVAARGRDVGNPTGGWSWRYGFESQQCRGHLHWPPGKPAKPPATHRSGRARTHRERHSSRATWSSQGSTPSPRRVTRRPSSPAATPSDHRSWLTEEGHALRSLMT